MHYVTLDAERQPDMLFRTPDRGGPPMERYNPLTATWVEDVSLMAYFVGDETGHVPIPDEQVPDVMEVLHRRAFGSSE